VHSRDELIATTMADVLDGPGPSKKRRRAK
jgi:hypothetical protein